MKEMIAKLMAEENLTRTEAEQSMREMMTGMATPSQIAGFLVALRCKGESVEEIAGCAQAMREAAQPMAVHPPIIVDTCGTGGDGKQSFNISTISAFVVAGAGYIVGKHGNRSISSTCGSADILEMMGVRIDGPPAAVEQCINTIGIGFIYAPHFHPAMRYAMPTRKELGVRTIFNLLGPLTNPARAKVQLIGVYDPRLTQPLASVLSTLGHKGGLVVHSDGWDEITLHAPTRVSEMLGGKVRTFKLTRQDFGLPKVNAKDLQSPKGQSNADLAMGLLEGKKIALRYVVVANAAALIWIAERAQGQKKFTLKEAVKRADASLNQGKALKKFKQLAEYTHSGDAVYG